MIAVLEEEVLNCNSKASKLKTTEFIDERARKAELSSSLEASASDTKVISRSVVTSVSPKISFVYVIKVVKYWQNWCLSAALLISSSVVKLNSWYVERLSSIAATSTSSLVADYLSNSCVSG